MSRKNSIRNYANFQRALDARFFLFMVFFVACTFIAYAQDATPKKVPLYMQHTEPSGKKIEYKKVGDKSLSLYVLEPPTTATALRPAIVFFHGGGWTGGNVGQFNAQANYLAAQGMVAVQVQYRLVAPHSSDTPQICGEDAKSAMRWVRAHAKEFHIDPNRIAAAGGSAGGYLAAFTATVPGWNDPADDLSISPKPNALALFFPAIDISPLTSGNDSISSRFGRRVQGRCSDGACQRGHAAHDHHGGWRG